MSNDCVEWVGAINRCGYGWRTFRGKQMHASRAAWIDANGDPGKLHVLHKCNNRKCVNVDHLYLGDHQRNMKDRAMSGSQPNGKLSPEDVKTIRLESRTGNSTQADLARRFGISSGYVSQLVSGRYWTDVT